METAFDIFTVACFAGLVIAYFQFGKRDTRTLMHLMISGAAIANQNGQCGSADLRADTDRCGRRIRRAGCTKRVLTVVFGVAQTFKQQ